MRWLFCFLRLGRQPSVNARLNDGGCWSLALLVFYYLRARFDFICGAHTKNILATTHLSSQVLVATIGILSWCLLCQGRARKPQLGLSRLDKCPAKLILDTILITYAVDWVAGRCLPCNCCRTASVGVGAMPHFRYK